MQNKIKYHFIIKAFEEINFVESLKKISNINTFLAIVNSIFSLTQLFILNFLKNYYNFF